MSNGGREDMDIKELLRLNADRTLMLCERVEKCTEAINLDRQRRFDADVETDRREREWTQAIKENNRLLAVAVDNIKDTERAAVEAKAAVREHTGAHPLVPLDVDDTDKAIGKFVRSVARNGWVKAGALVGGGGGIGAVLHWLAQHLGK